MRHLKFDSDYWLQRYLKGGHRGCGAELAEEKRFAGIDLVQFISEHLRCLGHSDIVLNLYCVQNSITLIPTQEIYGRYLYIRENSIDADSAAFGNFGALPRRRVCSELRT
jgi:hypothetical protein